MTLAAAQEEIRSGSLGGSHTRYSSALFASLLMAACCCFLAVGCAQQRYGLRAEIPSTQVAVNVQGVNFIAEPTAWGAVGVSAHVDELLGENYVVALVGLTNSSSNPITLKYDSVEMVGVDSKGEHLSAACEPEALVSKLAKQRASRESHRNANSILLAMAVVHRNVSYSGTTSAGDQYSGNYRYNDYGAASTTLSQGLEKSKSQGAVEADIVHWMDDNLLRSFQVPCGGRYGGLVVFPFKKFQKCRVQVEVGGEAYRFVYLLRTY